jgi:hypothetical protein
LRISDLGRRYPVVAKFYELLTWLNGPDSVFETNDCALGEPAWRLRTFRVRSVIFKYISGIARGEQQNDDGEATAPG